MLPVEVFCFFHIFIQTNIHTVHESMLAEECAHVEVLSSGHVPSSLAGAHK